VLSARVPEAYDVPAAPRWRPPTLPLLTGGLPGWIDDQPFLWRVVSERTDDMGGRYLWACVPTVLEVVDEILASDDQADTIHPDLSRAALRFLRQLAAALPTPLRRTNLPDFAMLRCLPPFGVLSPANPFLVALRLEAERLAELFLAPTDEGALAMVVHSLYELLATYTAAASLVVYRREHDADTTPPGGAA